MDIDDDEDEGEIGKGSTCVKVSLGSVGHDSLSWKLLFSEQLLLFINQWRFISSRFVSHFVYQQLADGNCVVIDQKLLSLAANVVLGTAKKASESREALLRSLEEFSATDGAVPALISSLRRMRTQLNGEVGGSTIAQLGQLAWRKHITNITIHAQERIHTAYSVGLKNLAKCHLYLHNQQYRNTTNNNTRLSMVKELLQNPPPDITNFVQQYEDRVKAVRAELTSVRRRRQRDQPPQPELPKLTRADKDEICARRIQLMYDMQQYTRRFERDELQQHPLLQPGYTSYIKYMSIIPQCRPDIAFVHVDSTAATHFVKARMQAAATAERESIQDPFGYILDMNKISRLRQTLHFAHHIASDGVTISVHFERGKRGSSRREPRMDAQDPPTHGSFAEDSVFNLSPDHNIACVDPGVRNLMVASRLIDPTTATNATRRANSLTVSLPHYQDVTQLRTKLHARQQDQQLRHLNALKSQQRALHPTPSSKSADQHDFAANLSAEVAVWSDQWAVAARRNNRRRRFDSYQRRQRFFASVATSLNERFSRPDQQLFILWGNGSDKRGGFSSVRGHAKGPTKALRRYLASRFVLISVCEFRTSCLCFACGHYLSHPVYGDDQVEVRGVCICTTTQKCIAAHRYVSRDFASACAIGARFFVRSQQGEPALGPFSRSTEARDIPELPVYDGFRALFV